VNIIAVDALGATCDPGDVSEPTSVNLLIEGIFNDGKNIVCEGGAPSVNVKMDVFFESPEDCKDGAVPPNGKTTAVVPTTGTGSPGTSPFVTDTQIKCRN
jgi:hypothetical protein